MITWRDGLETTPDGDVAREIPQEFAWSSSAWITQDGSAWRRYFNAIDRSHSWERLAPALALALAGSHTLIRPSHQILSPFSSFPSFASQVERVDEETLTAEVMRPTEREPNEENWKEVIPVGREGRKAFSENLRAGFSPILRQRPNKCRDGS